MRLHDLVPSAQVKAAQDARANSHRPTDHFVKGDRVKVSMEHLKLPIHSLDGAKKLRGKFVEKWNNLRVLKAKRIPATQGT